MRVFWRILLFGFLGLVLLAFFGPFIQLPVEILIALATGWLKFLVRTIPQVHTNWSSLGMAGVCVASILCSAHWFLRWISRHTRTARGWTESWDWPWKWTWCAFAGFSLMFVVGMAVGGAAHQIGWMASSPEPLVESRRMRRIMDYNNLRQLEAAVDQAELECKGDVRKMREWLWQANEAFPTKFAEDLRLQYHVFGISQTDGRLVGSLIFPRDGQAFSRVGGHFRFEAKSDNVPPKKIGELIEQYRSRLVAL